VLLRPVASSNLRPRSVQVTTEKMAL
jgi:hypothetical protein